ncbi:flagellar hook-length control protein FliK [Hypericibacter sp.]|uniref:flagellar hook-length control protein FliK n=1 Tax=Hypericibacter sp. TaxID=2705401 RepID=UPI003D6D6ACC
MEAIQTDNGTTGTAQSLFGKAAGQAGKGGGMFAALLALVGRQGGNAKETEQTGDGSANAAAGLQGLLALFNPMMANNPATDQNLIGDSGSDPLTAIASANGLDLSQLSDRNKLALLAQALANAKNGDMSALTGDDNATDAGSATDPTASDKTASQTEPGQTVSPADLDAILAELRARAAAKFGADNGKPTFTQDGTNAALAPKSDAVIPTGPSQTPLIQDGTLGLDPAATTSPVTATDNKSTPPTSPAHPAVAAGSFISLEPKPDADKPSEDGTSPSDGDGTPIDSKSTAAAPLPDGEAPPAKTPDPATSPFQKVEVAPPQTKKPDTRDTTPAVSAVESAKKAEPKSEPAPTGTASDGRADKAASDDSNKTPGPSDAADSASASNTTANTGAVDPRTHMAARTTIQVPADKLSQFLTQDDQLPLQIQRAVANGRDHITIQIVPHDLGRIEIKLDFDRSGTINTVIAADRPQTLELLRRDAGGLERALQDAGFKTDGSSLSFNLQGEQRQQYQNQQNNPGPAAWQAATAVADEAERSYRPTYRIASTADAIRAAADGRVNIAV